MGTANGVKSSRPIVPRPLRWHQQLAAWAFYALIRSVSATIRFEWRDQSGLLPGDRTQAVIFCIWHNRLALAPVPYHKYVKHNVPSRNLAALASASQDGGVLARVLEHFGMQAVRGSSSRRGPQALLELTSWAERGYDLAITPDGPRGPCYVVQDGVTALAQLTGLPIVPITYHLNWKIRLNSWDRFQVPLPFARCTMKIARAIQVPRGASPGEREQFRHQLENSLRALTQD
ncbi:MAG: hypothetical protein DME26_15315 [Verrucomicrobia bacterium]|nr:MAG: hypothetical protein DME26_15315 [Verrucomicrobiota bacterium]